MMIDTTKTAPQTEAATGDDAPRGDASHSVGVPSHRNCDGIGSSFGSAGMGAPVQKRASTDGCSKEGEAMADGTNETVKEADPLRVTSRSIVEARSANFGEEVEVIATVFNTGTVVLRLERHDLSAAVQLVEADAEAAAHGILRAIADARTVRALARDADACPACGGSGAQHVDGCPGDV